MTRDQTFRVAVRQFGPFERTTAELWAMFCDETGCDLTLDAVPLDLHPLYEATLAGDQMSKGDWDVVHLNTDLIAEAKALGSLACLDELIGERPPQDFPAGWPESLLGFQQFDDGVFGLPFHDGPEVLIYRRDLFEDTNEQAKFKAMHGRDLSVPRTWDDFVEVARFFNRPESGMAGTIFAAFPDGHNTVFDLALQVWTRGGELVDGDRVAVDTPAARDGLAWYRAILRDTSVVHSRCGEMDSVRAGLAFARGEAAMMVNWFGFAAMAEVVPESVVKGKLDIADVPAGPGGTHASLNCYWMYTLASGSPHRQVAYDFMRFATTAEADKSLTLNGGNGCRLSTWADADVNAEVPYTNRLAAIHQNARTLPRRADWSKVATVIDELVLATINSNDNIATLTADAQVRLDRLDGGQG
ncbi:MAG: extracellular solute-binding protein [Planctomycetota bacterium]